MKIGLISDTHDNIQNIQKATLLFTDKKVSFAIHAGDIVSPEAVEAFSGLKLIGVLGNNDLEIDGLTDAFDKIGGQLKGELCEMEQDDLIFAIYHGTNSRRKESLIQSGRYDIVVCGHTHMVQLLQYLIHRPENLSFYTCNTYLRKKQNIFASLPFFLWSIKTLPRIPYINNKYNLSYFK